MKSVGYVELGLELLWQVLRLLDGTQRDRDRLLLLSVIEKEDAVAARSMVEVVGISWCCYSSLPPPC